MPASQAGRRGFDPRLPLHLKLKIPNNLAFRPPACGARQRRRFRSLVRIFESHGRPPTKMMMILKRKSSSKGRKFATDGDPVENSEDHSGAAEPRERQGFSIGLGQKARRRTIP